MSKPNSFKNVPPPSGSKAGNPYTRFIPREELGAFASWQPDSLVGDEVHAAEASSASGPAELSAEEWHQRTAAARQSGYHDGYRDGMAALESFKQNFAQQATAQIGALLDAFDEQFKDLDARVAQAVSGIAVELAQQVLRSELAVRPELVAKVAAEAVNAVMLSARHISVHVHPHDLPLVAEGAEETLSARGGRLLADPSIERGGVLVRSDVGDVDARLAQRWTQAAGALAPIVTATTDLDVDFDATIGPEVA